MIRMLSYVGILALAAPALAQETQPRPASARTADDHRAGHDPYGPWTGRSRSQDKKGMDQLYKAMEDAWKKGDVRGAGRQHRLPRHHVERQLKGSSRSHFEATREQWIGFMKPMVAMPKDDMKMSHKHKVHFLSDTPGGGHRGQHHVGQDEGQVEIHVGAHPEGRQLEGQGDGEAGWGDMTPTETAAEKARTPTNTLPATPPRPSDVYSGPGARSG